MARAVAVIGASGTGKSTLVDRLCRLGGTEPPGPAPQRGSRIARFSYMGEPWCALDCPGSVELLQDSADALLAADAAVICVSPDPDQAVLAAPYLRAVEASGTPAILFVNRMDDCRARVRDIVAALQDYASHPIVLRQVPIREGDRIAGVVDLVSERAWRYREGEPSMLVEIPPSVADREHEARDELLEHLSEFDDWLLEEIVEDHTPAEGPVYAICARVLAENRAIPVLLGAASHANGIQRLMKALRHEAPAPEVLRARLAGDGRAEDLLAVGFQAGQRRHVGHMVFLRAFEAGLKPGARLAGGTVGALLDPSTEKAGREGETAAGEVVAAVKSDHLAAGGLYAAAGTLPAPGWRAPLGGQVSRVFHPASDRDEVKLSTALARMAADDPGMGVAQDPETGAQIVSAQGPLHLRLIRETLSEVFGIETSEAPVPPVYRETITRPASVHYRHRKQSGGAGQFADVRLEIAPAPRGAGFSFAETVKGGAVPRNYIPAVEAGAREATERGPLGFPVVDVAVTLTDGLHHSVDSSDMAFRIAARAGVQQALAEAVPVLLQPYLAVRFHVPSVFSGALVPLVSSLHGQVLGFDRDPEAKGWDVFRALLPGAAVEGLAGALRSITQGVGRFDAEFDHYQEVYGRESEAISEARAHAGGRR